MVFERRRAATAPQPRIYRCANCCSPLTGPDAAARGPDVAWHGCCRACLDLAGQQMELAEERPDGAKIQIWRCLRCGDLRACRAGWRTRCHVCLDERTNETQLQDASQECLASFAADPTLGLRVGQSLAIARGAPITPRVIVEATACLTVATQLVRFVRPGWTMIATDVHGLPWRGIRTRPDSHGTWARHDACGTLALMRAGSVDCPACGPEPGSRTYAARTDERYLLYQVQHRGLTKFGIGTEDRVRAHQRAGAEVIQVLRAAFPAVVQAERQLKTTRVAEIVGKRTRKMPVTFGQATEVLPRGATLRLADVLPGAEDVTSLFR